MTLNHRHFMAGLAGLSLMAVAGCHTAGPETQAAGQLAAVDLSVGTVATLDWPTAYEAGGVVRPAQSAVITSRVVAAVLEVRVQAGDRVRRGQTLVVLDGREVQAHATRAMAAASGSTLGLEAAKAEARAADSALVLARATFARVKGLHERQSATTQELDEATAALAGAEARVAGARARAAEAEQGMAASRAAEQAASVGVSYSVLTAPFDGVVSARHADPGSMAAPGTPLLVLDDSSAYRLEARIDESHARLVTVGSDAEIQLDGAPGSGGSAWIRSRVLEIAQIDPARHSFVVKFDLPPSAAVRSGQFGRARLLGASRQVLATPASAIVRRGQLTFAFVVDPAGAARLRMVSVGQRSATHVEVLAGLMEGDRVVLGPPATLEDGRPVRGMVAGAGGDTK